MAAVLFLSIGLGPIVWAGVPTKKPSVEINAGAFLRGPPVIRDGSGLVLLELLPGATIDAARH
jgi:hypothetical protein